MIDGPVGGLGLSAGKDREGHPMEREMEPSQIETSAETIVPRAIIVDSRRLGPQPQPPQPKRGQIRRPKHVPQRTCIACRDKDAKRTLTRIVRTPDGQVEIDPTGKRNGRGAYLCSQASCWRRALTTPLLGRALKTEIDDTARMTLHAFADSLPDDPATMTATSSNERTF